MKLPIIDLTVHTLANFDSPYAQIENSSTLTITNSSEDILEIKCEKPLGIKFMGMTVATLSKIKVDANGEVLEHEIEAPFLVKKQVENEIFKAIKKIPFGVVRMYLANAGISESAKVEVEIKADKSVEVKSDTAISLGRPRKALKTFKISQNGDIEGENLTLSGEAWTKFQSMLS